jgi:hypothetical protein
LVQATVAGKRAREIVESFPPSCENYPKAVACLKARFGREDLLVEVYVREVLKMIISAHQAKEVISLSSLYKLQSHLRALETLGVTTDTCLAMLSISGLYQSCTVWKSARTTKYGGPPMTNHARFLSPCDGGLCYIAGVTPDPNPRLVRAPKPYM